MLVPPLVPGDRRIRIIPWGLSSPLKPEIAEQLPAILSKLHAEPYAYTPELHPLSFLLADSNVDRQFERLAAETRPDVLWFVRGGCGAYRLNDRIPWKLLADLQPWIVGYSDVSPVLIKLALDYGLIGIHGPMLGSDVAADRAADISPMLHHGVDVRLAGEWVGEGRDVAGPFYPANLATLASWVPILKPPQTPYILGLEEIDEFPYRIHRMFWTLQAAGWLDHAEAVVLGGFTRCEPPANSVGKESAEDVLAFECKTLGIPLLKGLNFGHEPFADPVYVGASSSIDVSGNFVQSLFRQSYS